MKLIQLHLHPFAGTVNRTYNFEDGLNCIIQWYNKNEKNFKITDKKFIIQK